MQQIFTTRTLPQRVSPTTQRLSQSLSTINTPAADSGTPNPDLFSYTSGRYLYNEKLRFEERHVEFNVEALREIAASAVGGKHVVQLRKLAEGGFNRVFALTMDDGLDVIAKIHYPLTVPKTYSTESEVATLEFLRLKGIPVPRVYAYSSTSDNAVGSEYIIMEKAPGQPLERRWFELSPKERVRLVTSFVEIEQKLFAIPFASYGSLYYKDNPSADYMFWRGKRAALDLNRGPWKDHRDYVRSVGQRELEWATKYGKPRQNDFPHNNMMKGEISPDIYADLLKRYILISPHILPSDHANAMNKPTMRHLDLNPPNVFVNDSCEVSCIIDWQHRSTLPLLLTAGNPPLFQNTDSEPPKSLAKPSLPDKYDSLSLEENSELTNSIVGEYNKSHLQALRYPLLAIRQHAVESADRQWSGNVITLKGALIRLWEHWDKLIADSQQKVECPIFFDKEDVEEFLVAEGHWFKATILLEHWRSLLDDLGQDGWVRHESYEQLKQEWLSLAEDEEDSVSVDQFWPFQDHEEYE
ncbi:hypothetical protein BO94DRAFT_568281 [Aspergillus sclerotioniger CBS 115572]|uniref:Aminoglycoside phosphotransferase domain-containing protein n=1 Tax=Aspergillus sclerotioniger CBS 115572 TaxID=1450535 RepID=A0A317VWC6_9EURO|nr:hypothetical protein BO94DRAFT_568281 [Aspergillus sclerotioniger CBS 115572]PWY77317.1 hypothetical protein BO94DRAFT_568281 [Aspergillus sclerotioniger CBS 115572]